MSEAARQNSRSASHRSTQASRWRIRLLACCWLALSNQASEAQTMNSSRDNSDARMTISRHGAAGPLLVMIATEHRAAASDQAVTAISQAGFQVLLLHKADSTRQRRTTPALTASEVASSVVAAIQRTAQGPAVIVAENRNTDIARQIALEHPEQVRGLILAGEATTTSRDNPQVPAAATLYLTGDGADRRAAEQARKEWGSRVTVTEIAGAGQAPFSEQPQRTATAIIAWLRGPALSAGTPGTRITLPEEAMLTDQQKALQQQILGSLNSPEGRRVGAIGPRAVLLHDPKLLQGYTAMGDVMASAPLPLRYKELAILVTARAMDSDYEWAAHERPALAAGVPESAVTAIKYGRTPSFEHPADRIIYAYTDELHRNHKVSDATYRQAWDLLGTNGLVNLTIVIGHYVNVAFTLNAHQLELPAGAQPLPARAAP